MEEQITDITLFRSTLLKNKKLFLLNICLSLLVSFFYSFFSTQKYQGYTTIYPSYNSDDLSKENEVNNAIKSFIGNKININSNLEKWGAESFYIPDLVFSKKLKKKLINKEWDSTNGKKIKLIDLFGIKDQLIYKIKKMLINIYNPYVDEHKVHNQFLIQELGDIIYCRVEDSGLIFIKVVLPDPLIASDMANYISDFVSSYIKNELETNASKYRKDIGSKLLGYENKLIDAEMQITNFRKKNPIALDTPDKQIERARLIRELEINQKIFLNIKKQHEIAKYNEAKFKPAINILDRSEVSSSSVKPNKLLVFIIMFFLSVLATFIANRKGLKI